MERTLMTRMIALLLVSLMLPSTAYACLCLQFENAQEHIDRTDVIFEGVVTKIEMYIFDADRKTEFRVTHVWKGKVRARVTINYQVSIDGNCGTTFRKGAAYIVFADRSKDGALYTSRCSWRQFDWSDYEAILKRNGSKD